jgi:integrase/recombinase XerC
VRKNTSRKVIAVYDEAEDLLTTWKNRFLESEIKGERDPDTVKKIDLQVQRFIDFFRKQYGHERVSAVVRRDVLAWLDYLYGRKEEGGAGLAAATVNNHKAHLSRFMTWLHEQAPHLLPDNPVDRIKDFLLPAPEPRALTEDQVRSLKNLCDRLERFHQLKGRQWRGSIPPLKKNARPKRDRAIVYTLLSTGLRREMLVNLNLDQLEPNDPGRLRIARRAKLVRVRGKGRTEVTKFLSEDARQALADYLEFERPQDVDPESRALFLTASGVPERKPGGRMHPRSINRILEQIGKWHDAEQTDPERYISPLRPHDLRHTYAFLLSQFSHGDRSALQRELGHRNDRYLDVYTNPPEDVAARWIEKL